MRTRIGLVLWVSIAATTPVLAQNSGAEVYKAKCQYCHGVSGMGDGAVGKALKVKPITDPSVKKQSPAQMIEATKSGTGKMEAFKGKLSEAQIRDVVDYFRTFLK